MMNRSTFRRPVLERVRTVHKPIPLHLRRGVITPVDASPAPAIEKDCAIEHEGYRRLVAKRPCSACHIEGYSQAAHPNTDKGKGIKADDRECFPLCCTRPGIPGCHYEFDQHRMFPSREEARAAELRWGQETRDDINATGQWPKNLPQWSNL